MQRAAFMLKRFSFPATRKHASAATEFDFDVGPQKPSKLSNLAKMMNKMAI
jgi:hypothetical protein